MANTSVGTKGASASAGLIVALLGVMFFVFGFVTWLNGPLIAFVKLAFTLTDVEAFLIPMTFYASYFVFALPAAAVLKKTGMKRGMAAGLLVMAIGAGLFGQFATVRLFTGALGGLFVIGAGLALLQTAVNPYVSIVGPIDSAARRIAVMGVCNKTAGILAPIAFGLVVMRGVGDLGALVASAPTVAAREAILGTFAQQIRMPYFGMAAILALLALGVLFSPLPELGEAADDHPDADAGVGGLRSYPHLWLGVVCLFFYVGVEVMAGDAIGTYGASFGLPISQTAYFTSLTLAGMLAGYLVGIVTVPSVISQQRYLAASAVLGLVFVVGAFATTGYMSVAFVAALGFANAMMWPAIFPLAIRGLGRHTETGSAIMIMAISGGAVIPQAFAVLKQSHPFQLVFLMLMGPAYLFILYYALVGHRVGMGGRVR